MKQHGIHIQIALQALNLAAVKGRVQVRSGHQDIREDVVSYEDVETGMMISVTKSPSHIRVEIRGDEEFDLVFEAVRTDVSHDDNLKVNVYSEGQWVLRLAELASK